MGNNLAMQCMPNAWAWMGNKARMRNKGKTWAIRKGQCMGNKARATATYGSN